MKVHKIAAESFCFLVRHTVAADKITKSKNIPFSAFKIFGLWLQNPKTSSPFYKFSKKFVSVSFPIGKNKLLPRHEIFDISHI